MLLYIAIIKLTKGFDLLSKKNICYTAEDWMSPKFYNIKSLKTWTLTTRATIQHDGSVSDSIENKSGIKQGYILALTLFGIFTAIKACINWWTTFQPYKY